jgi:hypothetical protein
VLDKEVKLDQLVKVLLDQQEEDVEEQLVNLDQQDQQDQKDQQDQQDQNDQQAQ